MRKANCTSTKILRNRLPTWQCACTDYEHPSLLVWTPTAHSMNTQMCPVQTESLRFHHMGKLILHVWKLIFARAKLISAHEKYAKLFFFNLHLSYRSHLLLPGVFRLASKGVHSSVKTSTYQFTVLCIPSAVFRAASKTVHSNFIPCTYQVKVLFIPCVVFRVASKSVHSSFKISTYHF